MRTVFCFVVYISIHRLREEPDQKRLHCERIICISIHRLREEPDLVSMFMRIYLVISIHRLREEPDGIYGDGVEMTVTFQSTGSVRSPTVPRFYFDTLMCYFNPQAP